jgi:transposase InsO family protein
MFPSEMSETVCSFGKLTVQGQLTAVAPGQLLYVKDAVSCLKFLVDSGSSYSIYPCGTPHGSPTGPMLQLPNKQLVPSYGEKVLTVEFSGKTYVWSFLLADISFPIIGADFLRYFKLLVDLSTGLMLDLKSMQTLRFAPATGGVETASIVLASVASLKPSVRDLLLEFQDVTNERSVLPNVVHDVTHEIETVSKPTVLKFRRLDPVRLEIAKKEFATMEKDGIVRRSNSSWAAPLHMVPKKDGTWRPCGDFRLLNNCTVSDKYPLPNMLDLSSRLGKAKVFSKLDLRKGYWQIPVHEKDIHKTAVVTPFGLFEFLRMPFGLKNAGATFQRLMDRVTQGLDFQDCYLDDMLVFSEDEDKHVEDIRSIFERLREFGLVLNLEKCKFMQSEVEFLGHRISARGIEPMGTHVESILKFPTPTDLKNLQSFLGMVNFYRRFIPHAAHMLKPFTDMLKGGSDKAKFIWSSELDSVFEKVKKTVAELAPLSHPREGWELSLAVDASNAAAGAVLQQREKDSDSWLPLGFFSKKFNSAQQNYSTFDRELTAINLGIKHFRHLLEASDFHILTDHKALTFALKKKDPSNWTPRQQRQLSFIAEFTTDLRYIAGKENVVADALSRPASVTVCEETVTENTNLTIPVFALDSVERQAKHEVIVEQRPRDPDVQPPILAAADQVLDLARLARDQLSCQEVQQLMTNTVLTVRTVTLQDSGLKLLVDCSLGTSRPLVPEKLKKSVFESLHNLSHPGMRATQKLISARFVWKGMAKDIKEFCRNCIECHNSKVQTHVRAPVEKIEMPSRRFGHLHVDIVGPLPSSQDGFTHLFTIIDRSTRWAEAVPLKGTATRDCISAFLTGWISRFGIPDNVTTDRGAQFSSAEWKNFLTSYGITQHMTTAFHPQSNGMVERFHRSLKNSLRAKQNGKSWTENLPLVLLGLRTVQKMDSGLSCAEMVYGCALTLPGQFQGDKEKFENEIFESFTEEMNSRDAIPVRDFSYSQVAGAVPESLEKASHVYVRRGGHVTPLQPLYDGPFLVLNRTAKVFTLLMGEKQELISVDRLKPHLGRNEPVPGVPRRRGRPPKSSQYKK